MSRLQVRVSVCIASVACLLTLERSLADVAQWDFDIDLESTTGQAALVEGFGPPEVQATYTFESTTIGGATADVVHFSRGTYFHALPGMPPNGGGVYVNQYTLVMDVMFPDRSPSGGWASLYQTNDANANDGDWFVNPDGGIGISNNYGGSVPDGEWHRLALVVDLVAGTFTSFIDGVQVQQNTAQEIDGRFSLYSVNDGGIDGFTLFADDSGDNSEGYVNSVQFRDVALAPADIAAMGGPSADGIPIPSDPRDCSFRNFQVRYDRLTNTVTGMWLTLPGEHGFRVFRGNTLIAGPLPADATSFTDSSPLASATGVIYTLKPLLANGLIERECPAAPVDTFGCIEALTCCPDQVAKHVTLSWSPSTNVTLSGFRVSRNGAEIGTAGSADSSFTDATVLAPGTYTYEVAVLSAGNPVCSQSCRTTVTGIPIGPAGTCGGVLNTYDFNGDLKSSTGGRDLVPMISTPIDPATGSPEFSFEDATIGGKTAKVCRYSRGTFFRLYSGLGPNGGGIYTNRFTLIMDLLFEADALDESGYAALLQTNETNANDGDWFVQAADRGVGISGNYGGFVADDEWNRLVLVVDLVEGTFTSFVNGRQVQQNTGEALDGRFSLYTTNDGDFEGISIFADDSGDNSAGLVNSVQIRDVALTPDEVAAFGSPTADGIPAGPPCPHALACVADQVGKSITLTWQKGFGLPGTGFTIRRNGATIATVPLTAETYTDFELSPGLYVYELSLDAASGCENLPISCGAEVIGGRLFFEDFEGYENNNDLSLAGWEIHDVNAPTENDAWTVLNPGHRANPPTSSGKPTSGRFVISDSAFGGSADVQNTAGSGVSYELWSPVFSASGASAVWLHFDAAAQLNNNGDAVFQVDVSTDGGASWTNVLERVSPGRTIDPLPKYNDNADGLFGRVHVDLSGVAGRKNSVRIRFTHFEPTWDWWVAVDNVLIDQTPGDAGSVVLLPVEAFGAGIPASWKAVSGPEGSAGDAWSTQDVCSISLGASGGTFPDPTDGLQLHHLGNAFAIIDPVCSSAKADEYLITPSLDLSGQTRVFLSFSSATIVSSRATAEVLLSLDGGTTFLPTPVFSYKGGGLVVLNEEPYFNDYVLEVPAAAGQAKAAFAFHYPSQTNSAPQGSWWAIDDVKVTGSPSQTSKVFHRGDSDDNGELQLTDAIRVLGFLFLGGAIPTCLDAADADDNGELQLTDAIRILGFLFLGGPPPAPPGPPGEACGPDAGGELGCEAYSSC